MIQLLLNSALSKYGYPGYESFFLNNLDLQEGKTEHIHLAYAIMVLKSCVRDRMALSTVLPKGKNKQAQLVLITLSLMKQPIYIQ